MGTKINHLINQWRPGLVFTAAMLKESGIGYDLQNAYRRSGWIESIGSGAFKKTGDKVDWPGGLHALQQQLELNVHLGGKSALIEQGFSHYLYAARTVIDLFILRNEKIPKWFLKRNWSVKMKISRTAFLPYNIADSYIFKDVQGFNLRLSSAERAALEMLYYIPHRQSFDEALKIFEFLTTLRPKTVQALLEGCNSVKAKRLFLFMAAHCNHIWFENLDMDKFYLGQGKRVIVENGVLDSKYQITVPEKYQK